MAMKATVDMKRKKLIVEIDLQEPRPSGSGKSIVIATSGGNQKTEALYDGKVVTVGMSAYYKA